MVGLNLSTTVSDHEHTMNLFGIFSPNCHEWLVTDIAGVLSGMTVVPFYPNSNADFTKYVINKTGL